MFEYDFSDIDSVDKGLGVTADVGSGGDDLGSIIRGIEVSDFVGVSVTRDQRRMVCAGQDKPAVVGDQDQAAG